MLHDAGGPDNRKKRGVMDSWQRSSLDSGGKLEPKSTGSVIHPGKPPQLDRGATEVLVFRHLNAVQILEPSTGGLTDDLL